MQTDEILKGEKVTLRPLLLSDCTQEYADWLNDPEINKYLECRWQHHTIDTLKSFAQSIHNDKTSFMFAIEYNGKQIGNIKLNIQSQRYKRADVGYFIGNKDFWGKGLATEAVKLIVNFGFEKLDLNKIVAGAFEQNLGSIKVLSKAGFCKEACFKKHSFLNDETSWSDVWEFGILKDDWKNFKKEK